MDPDHVGRQKGNREKVEERRLTGKGGEMGGGKCWAGESGDCHRSLDCHTRRCSGRESGSGKRTGPVQGAGKVKGKRKGREKERIMG